MSPTPNLERLKEPFPEKDIEWRIGRAGITNARPWGFAIAYITARAAQDRLDEVFGIGGWEDSYHFEKDGVMCTLRAKIGDTWVAKQNGAELTEIEAFKGGISGAFKRAASNWGIGRYLYDLTESFVTFQEAKTGHSAKIDNKYYNWIPPKLPDWALPAAVAHTPAQASTTAPSSSTTTQTSSVKQQSLPIVGDGSSADKPAVTKPVGKPKSTQDQKSSPNLGTFTTTKPTSESAPKAKSETTSKTKNDDEPIELLLTKIQQIVAFRRIPIPRVTEIITTNWAPAQRLKDLDQKQLTRLYDTLGTLTV